MARIGILGGTFNPPHLGHLALARHARAQLGLQRVLLVPAHLAPNKPAPADDPGPAHRLAMCRLAVAGEPGLEVSALEIERGGTSYTVDTVQLIHRAHPDAELTLIVGADTARTLPAWREPARLLGMVGLAVAERDEADADDVRHAPASALREEADPGEVREALSSIPGLASAPAIAMLRMSPVAISSSAVRALLAAAVPSPAAAASPPTAAVPSPTAAVPSPTAAVPSPTAEVPSPAAAVPPPTAEVPSPTAEVPSPAAAVPPAGLAVLVGEAVARYIAEHRLYRPAGRAATGGMSTGAIGGAA